MSNETKQTAVDYIISEISHPRWMALTSNEIFKIYEQAKEMEKQQIIDALLFGDVLSPNMAENYYNETYGGGNK